MQMCFRNIINSIFKKEQQEEKQQIKVGVSDTQEENKQTKVDDHAARKVISKRYYGMAGRDGVGRYYTGEVEPYHIFYKYQEVDIQLKGQSFEESGKYNIAGVSKKGITVRSYKDGWRDLGDKSFIKYSDIEFLIGRHIESYNGRMLFLGKDIIPGERYMITYKGITREYEYCSFYEDISKDGELSMGFVASFTNTNYNYETINTRSKGISGIKKV